MQQTNNVTSEAQKPLSEFVPVGEREETTSATAMLVAAYLLMWAAVFAFVLMTLKKQKSIDTRLGEIDRALKKAEQSSNS